MDYKARFYSPYINRFTQPDSLIPSPANPQSLNRFGYVVNNPIRFNDPTGHVCSDPEDPNPTCFGSGTTRVGDRMVRGNGAELGRAKSFPIKQKDKTPPKPWVHSIDVQLEMHIGPIQDGNVPDHNGSTEYPDNVPYVPGISNPGAPNACAGGRAAAVACLISLGTSIAMPYGPINTDPNFYLSFSVSYVEATNSINMSTIQMSNFYNGNATLAIAVNNRVITLGDAYIPQGGYIPIEMSRGQYDGTSRLTIEVMVRTLQNTPNGSSLIPHPMEFVLPSLPEAKSIVLSGLP